MSQCMTEPTKWPEHPVWSESSLWSQWVAKDPSFIHVDSEDWSDWEDVQADRSLRWAHSSFCWFCHAVAQIIGLTGLGKQYTSRPQGAVWSGFVLLMHYCMEKPLFQDNFSNYFGCPNVSNFCCSFDERKMPSFHLQSKYGWIPVWAVAYLLFPFPLS